MQQSSTTDVLDQGPATRAASTGALAGTAPANIHRVRPARATDVDDMEQVERLAFPTLVPPTRFHQEVQKSNTRYLVAERDWTREELELGPDAFRAEPVVGRGLAGGIQSLLKLPATLLFQTVRSRNARMPSTYVVGIVGLWFVMDEAHVVIIGNRPSDRRKGLGELLLISALEVAIDSGVRVVTLEVRSSNRAARALYHKYGFREVGVRRHYYADNNEDAVIMTTPPIQGEEYRSKLSDRMRDHELRWGPCERWIS